MSELIQSQLKTIAVMMYCGLTAGLVLDVFRLFIRRFCRGRKIMSKAVKIFCCITIAFLVSDFLFFCENGKITATSAIVFAVGLWLWRKFFYDIIGTGEKDEQKGTKA